MRRVALLVVVLALVATACSSDERSGPLVVDDLTAVEFDYDFLIPAGTGERFDRGEYIEILPGQLEVSVGEVLRIVNGDDRDHLVGPFFVAAGETLTQRFAAPGGFGGLCTIHASGRFELRVSN